MANVIIVVPPAIKVRPTGYAPEVIYDTLNKGTIGDVWPPGLIDNATAKANFVGYDPLYSTIALDGVNQTVTAYGPNHVEFTVNSTIQMGEVTLLSSSFVPPSVGLGTWASSTTYIHGTRERQSSAGTVTDAIIAGGFGGGVAVAEAASFNGTAYSSETYAVDAIYNTAHGGTSTSFMLAGGHGTGTSVTAGCREYDGTAFSYGTTIPYDGLFNQVQVAAGDGTLSNFLITGGYDRHGASFLIWFETFVFTGTAWATEANMLAQYGAHVGTGNGASFMLTGCGADYTTGVASFYYNGVSWASETDCIVGKGSSYAGNGNGAYGMFIGGTNQSAANEAVASVVVWEDGVWTSIAGLGVNRRYSTCVGDGGSAALQFCGNSGGSTNVSTTLEYS